MTNDALKKIIKSFVPANENNPTDKNSCCSNLTIVARDQGQVAIGHGQNRNIRIFMGLPILGIIVFVATILTRLPISVNMAQNIADTAAAIAKCENKHPNKIHNELKSKYGYQSYSRIGIIKYYQIMRYLTPRTKCIVSSK